MASKKPDSGPQNQPAEPVESYSSLVADRDITALLANISHELRIPMDAILGYVDLIRDTALDDHQQTIMTQIERAARGLLDIIEDVHSLSRMDAGKLEIHKQPFSIRDCVDSVAQMLAPSAYSRGLDFIRVIDSDVPINLLGDPLRIRQILVNLIGNAIKFTQTGHVRLKISAHPFHDQRYELVMKVSDTGIGIAQQNIGDLFKPFSQPAKPQADISGTGLGLVICQSLCDQMGGSITAHSIPGGGSTFCARIVVEMLAESFQQNDSAGVLSGRNIAVCCADNGQAQWIAENLRQEGATTRIVETTAQLASSVAKETATDDALLAVICANELQDHDELEHSWRNIRGRLPILCLASSGSGNELEKVASLIGGDALPSHSPIESIIRATAMLIQRSSTANSRLAAQHMTPQLLADLNLLVADDNEFSRDYLQMLLRMHGATVDVCPDGLMAYEMISQNTYDLVLMDVRMPECDGVAAMQKIVQSGTACPPIIGLTAAPEECCRALNAGMTDCLLKPIRPSVLLQYIRTHEGKRTEDLTPQAHTFVDKEMRAELNIELPRRANDLSGAIKTGDMTQALEAAHKVSGAAALCGFHQLHATAASIEGLIRQHQLDGLARLSIDLKNQIEEALASLAD